MLWALPAVALAGLVHGVFGIGFPLVATPLLALITDVRTAVLLTLLPTVAVNLTILLRGGGSGAVVREHWRILPFSLVGAGIGTLLLAAFDPRPFLLLLAAAILVYLNQDRLQSVDLGWVHHRRMTAYGIFGLASGLMAGMVNVMLPVLIILAMELRLSGDAMARFFNMNFLGAKLVQILLFTLTGLLSWSLAGASVFLVPAALLAVFVGGRLRRRISEERYRSVLRGLLWVMAGILVLRFAAG